MLTLNAIRLPNLHHMSNVSVIHTVLISQHYDIKFSQSAIYQQYNVQELWASENMHYPHSALFNNASDSRSNGLYRNPNPNPLVR